MEKLDSRTTNQGLADNPARGATYTLVIFVLLHLCLNIDRAVLSIVTEPIKAEFKVADTQIGLLHLGFAALFATCGIPLGRWVDRGVRRTVLVTCTLIFSVMTALGGAATNFTQLMATRLLVGAGEAGGGPAMLSMMSDLVPERRRASAVSVYYLGVPLAFIFTFFLGGRIAEAWGWRSVFLLAGAPGVALSILVLMTIREPRRGAQSSTVARSYGWGASLRFILAQPALRHLLVTTMLTSALAAAVVSWTVSFLIRSHHLSLPEAGLFMAVTYGLLGAVGTLAGGWVADRVARRDARWRVWTCAIAAGVACPALVGFLLAPSVLTAALAFGVWSLIYSMLYGPVLGLLQSLAPPRMRGTATSIYYVLSHFAGVGGGPLLVGLASDMLRPIYGDDSLRYGLLAMSVLYIWAALHFLLAGRTLRRDLAKAEALEAGV